MVRENTNHRCRFEGQRNRSIKNQAVQRNLTRILAYSIVCTILSCSKKLQAPSLFNSQWKEVSRYISGGGQAVWEKTPTEDIEIFLLKKNHSVYSSRFLKLNKYLIRNESGPYHGLVIYRDGDVDSVHLVFNIISADTIEIQYECIEACIKKFVIQKKRCINLF